ncbi:MAG: hypothetical protein ACTJHT_12965 [Sphingobacterium sp.]|uniref:hypothetical protein n=1 Tax=Sphingobacterium sp. JB170 TaxID=1434842 RepID=UPI00097F29B9|nr:hypothetical protein [Sphingobacterium sp. JB170]SJN36391.1 hypothetical protein FM107_08850 [Sphingobacterium sp. JB170]
MNLQQLNVVELSSGEVVEISGRVGGPARDHNYLKYITPITVEDVCRELGS